ncbi:hypothetical protein SFUMM280S_10907 [Streptomyces fumanus]
MAAAPAHLLGGRGGRQRRAGQPEQAAGGGADLGVAQRLAEGAGVLAALPDQVGEGVEGGVQVAVDIEVTGHPGAGQAQFAGLEQQTAQCAAVADDEHGRVRRPGLGAVPGADADGERGPQQLFDEALQPQRGVCHDAHLRETG